MEKEKKTYTCQRCRHTWNFVEKTAGDVPENCPKCSSYYFDSPVKLSRTVS